MIGVPAATAAAILDSLEVLGLDKAEVATEAGLSLDTVRVLGSRVPEEHMHRLWDAAFRRRPGDGLVTEVGLHVPFGAFGPIDYLAASAATVGEALALVADNFSQVATGAFIEQVSDRRGRWLRIINSPRFEGDEITDEFTIAAAVGRMRALAASPVGCAEVLYTRPPGPQDVHASLLRAPVTYGASSSAVLFAEQALSVSLARPDPGLRGLIEQVIATTAGAEASDIERLVRIELRHRLGNGSVRAADVARGLGVSQRSLQRRLGEVGTCFRAVLERARSAEAERLLRGSTLAITDIAARLGYADQATFTRAFRRHHTMGPAAWRDANASSSDQP